MGRACRLARTETVSHTVSGAKTADLFGAFLFARLHILLQLNPRGLCLWLKNIRRKGHPGRSTHGRAASSTNASGMSALPIFLADKYG